MKMKKSLSFLKLLSHVTAQLARDNIPIVSKLPVSLHTKIKHFTKTSAASIVEIIYSKFYFIHEKTKAQRMEATYPRSHI